MHIPDTQGRAGPTRSLSALPSISVYIGLKSYIVEKNGVGGLTIVDTRRMNSSRT